MKTENWNDKKFVLEKVKRNGWDLEFASKELRSDKEVVLEAVQQCGFGFPLEYASAELRKDKEVVLVAVKKNGYALQFASDELRKDKEVVLEAVKQNGSALQYASHRLREDKEFVLSSLKENLWNHLFSSDSDCDMSHDPSDYNDYTCNSWCGVKDDIFSALRYAKIDLEQNDK